MSVKTSETKSIENLQVQAIKKANIQDNDLFTFEIVDIKKLTKNNDFLAKLNSFDKKDLLSAIKSGARYMLAVYENDTMDDETITLQPIDAFKMESLKDLNIKGLSSVAKSLYNVLKDLPPFQAGETIEIGLNYEDIESATISIDLFKRNVKRISNNTAPKNKINKQYNLNFEKIDNDNYLVCVDFETAGELVKSNDEWDFIYNDENGTESIAYYESLKETQKQLEIEFMDGFKNNLSSFGSFKY